MNGLASKLYIVLVFCLLLAGCGGGGGDGNNPPASDTTPNAFGFAPVTGAALNSVVESEAVTIGGINAAAAISISGGEYAINDGDWTSTVGTITNGQSVKVRVQSSTAPASETSATLAIGDTSADFKVTTLAADTTPDAFEFTAVTGAPLAQLVESAAVTVAGINTAAPVSVTGGEYAVAGGDWTGDAGTVTNGQTVRVRVTSSTEFSAETMAMLTIGGVSTEFKVTTLAPNASDTTPDAFFFEAVTGAARNTLIESEAVTVSGIDATTAISVTDGEYSINDGEWTSANGEISNGQSVRVRLQSSTDFGTEETAMLTIGGVQAEFSVTTELADTVPNAFTFTAQTGVARDTAIESDAVTVGGINTAATISIDGGEYAIADGGWTAANGTITNGQSVRVRVQSSADFATETIATLTIGGVDAPFSVTTIAADTTPDDFAFEAATDATLDTEYVSNEITVSGINSAAAISVTGGDYAIDDGEWTSANGEVNNGQSVRVRVQSSADFATETVATLTIGVVDASFSVTTVAEDITPAVFAFTPVTGATQRLTRTQWR